MRAISKVMLLGVVFLLMVMLDFCAFAMAKNVDGNMMTKDVICDSILADNYCRPDIISGIVNLEDFCDTNKINNDNGRITIVKEAEL